MPIVNEIDGLPKLPDEAQELVDIMNKGEALGASRNIRQINDIFVRTAKHWEGKNAQTLLETIQGTANYYIQNRGKNTPAIGNAINKVLFGISDIGESTVDQITEFLENKCTKYNQQSIENVTMIANLGANLLESSEVILAYDYSSSMMAVLRELGKRGHKKRLIIPESRDLDGGRPIAKESTVVGHEVDFVIDMAASYYMKDVDAVLIGAETIFSNGGCWNTIGSFCMAVLADYYRVPFYVPTELIKIDPNSFKGIEKEIKFDDYSSLLDYPNSFETPELISVTAPALDFVPPQLTTAFITERGVINPHLLWEQSRSFLDEINIDPFKL
jgi:ribose 1,5-bisphosphate isomerase